MRSENQRHTRSMLTYFALLFALTVPFWLAGEGSLPLPVNLPTSALAVFNPLIAALILIIPRSGLDGAWALIRKALDARRIPGAAWYVPALLLMPFLYGVAYALMRLLGRALPAPEISLVTAAALFALYVVAGAGEELGWTGFALEPMQRRWGALPSAITLGVLWAAWHVIPYAQAGHSTAWIVWQCVYTVALRVLIVWLYNHAGGSVLTAILLHATSNLSWSLFPNYGSHYDPFFTALVTVVAAAAAVAIGWGPAASARARDAAALRT